MTEKEICHRCFPVNLKGSLMLLKSSLMMGLKGSHSDGAKKFKKSFLMMELKEF